MTPDPALRTPVTVFLVVVNVALWIALAMVLHRPDVFVLRPAEAGIGDPGVAMEMEEAIEPEVVETIAIDEAEQWIQGDPRFNSDSPFEGSGTSTAIGIGAAAGGTFACRGSARAHLRAGGPAGDPVPTGTASFEAAEEPGFRIPFRDGVLSTFSVDVDTASYALVRRFLAEGRLPPAGAVRIEEMVNAFRYGDAPPSGGEALALRVDAASCPWEPRHRLVRIALKGREIPEAERPAANLVFLLDVSGSMSPPDRLPLVKTAVRMLLDRLDARDRVAIVVYAGAEGLALPSTPAGDREPILDVLDRLGAGGTTNGGAGIELAYRIAEENLVPGGINRVILATDGDFNVGVTDRDALVDLVAKKAEGGVFLSILGVGGDNLKDATLVRLAGRGNGNYSHIDGPEEARRVLVEQGLANLQVVAKDAKIQVEWNPGMVAGWRLVGYEKRALAAEDFRDERKDAGEIGVGHSVTAFYEVVPAGGEVPGASERPDFGIGGGPAAGDALLTARVRWKDPVDGAVAEIETAFAESGLAFDAAPEDFRFGAAVALFGMLLRGSPHAGSGNLDLVREIALGALGPDPDGRRAGFATLVGTARDLLAESGDERQGVASE